MTSKRLTSFVADESRRSKLLEDAKAAVTGNAGLGSRSCYVVVVVVILVLIVTDVIVIVALVVVVVVT